MNQLFTKTAILIISFLFFVYTISSAQDSLSEPMTNEVSSMKNHRVLSLKEGAITMQLPKNVQFLDKKEGKAFLNAKEKISSDLLGLLFLNENQAPIKLCYQGVGYVPDEAFLTMNVDDLMTDKQAREAKGNSVLNDWRIKPTYDKMHNKFYWAEKWSSKTDTNVHTSVYFGNILGKEGVITFSLKEEKGEDKKAIFLELLTNINFVEGHQYADFDTKTGEVGPNRLEHFLRGELYKEESRFRKAFKFWKFIILGAIGIFAMLRHYRRSERTSSNLNFE